MEADFLFGIGATSGTNAWAVGQYNNGTANRTLIEQWNGAKWSIQPSPSVGPLDNVLTGVDGTSRTNAWAVGERSSSGGNRTLIEHWDGSAWKVKPTPNYGNVDNAVATVAATSATEAIAVGLFNNGVDRALAIQFA